MAEQPDSDAVRDLADIMADMREALAQLPPRRELHCAPNVASWFAHAAPGGPPSGFGLDALSSTTESWR